MKKVSVREAKSYLSRMLEQVSNGKLSLKEAKAQISRLEEVFVYGEEIVITRDGEAVAKLVFIDD